MKVLRDSRLWSAIRCTVIGDEIRPGTQAYELMRGIGNLCVGRDSDPCYDPRRLVELLLRGLQRPQSS